MQNDGVLETRTCRISGKEFSITQRDAGFYKKISPKFGEYVAEIPFPTLCPEERQRRRLAFRNERKLYRRQCDASKKPIVSMYSHDKSYVVYDQKIWWSDEWDAMDYGISFDFTKTFTEQFDHQLHRVPATNLLNYACENSEYSNYTANSQNCYLCTTTAYSQDLLYCASGWHSQGCVDGLNLISCSACYDCIELRNCTGLLHSINCSDCSDSSYLVGCVGCSNCFNCVDLANKSYCINNIQYSKDEYFEKLGRLKGKVIERNIKSAQDTTILSENVVGRYLRECSNCIQCYHCNDTHDASYCSNTASINDCYDCNRFGFNSHLSCEIITAEETRRSYGIVGAINCDSIFYSSLCFDSQNLFGCLGVRQKQYAIFNKQYTREEYEVLVPKIIEHMKETGERGEFFDQSLSPFGYNETVAQEYFPIGKEEALWKGYGWSDYEAVPSTAVRTIRSHDLPQSIEAVTNDILKVAIECEVTGKLFRVIPQELAFYRKHGISLPRRHPDQRHLERLEMRR